MIEGVEVEVEAEEVAEEEALLIFYSVRKWRVIRRAGRRWRQLQ